MKISRQVGTQSQIIQVFAQDFSVTTGAGIANIPASTVSYSWFRNNQNGVSTGVGVSTASMGTYTSGAWTQVNSATALGWYQFGIPNDALLSGDCSALHLYVSTGAFNIAPIPIEIELTKTNNQQYMSSQTIGFVQNGVNVTSFSGAITTNANLLQIYGTAAVTSAGGQLRVSTQAIDKGGYGVTSIATAVTTTANIVQIYGSAAVTSAGGQLRVSTQTVDKTGYLVNVTSFSSAITTNANILQAYGSAIETSAAGQLRAGVDWANVTNKAAYNNLSSTFISTNQSITGASAPTAAQNAAAVWDEITTSHANASSFGALLRIMSAASSTWVTTNDAATSSQIIQGVWNELTTAYTSASSTFGLALYTAQSASGLTSTVVADAVWSKVNSSYSGVSTFGYVLKQVTSISAGVNVTAFSGAITTNANLLQIYGSAAVTSASGQLRVSTQAIDKGGYGVTTIASNITTNANILQAYGSAIVTSAAGVLNVSTQQLAGMSGSVNVSSIMGSPAVTTSAGVLLVSTQAIPAFATSSDSRLALLDASVSSRAADGAAMALTAAERATLAGVILTTTQAESYRSVNATGSLIQLLYETVANLTEQTASGTTRTLASVTSHTGNVAQYQYDSSSAPASIKRIS